MINNCKVKYLILLFITNLLSNQIHVPIDHSIYRYLDRLYVQGIVPEYSKANLPLSRNDIANYLILAINSRNKLSKVDRYIFDEYWVDFLYYKENTKYYQLSNSESTFTPFSSFNNFKKGVSDLFYYTSKQPDNHLAVYEKDDNLIWFDVGGIARLEKRENNNRLLYSYHYSLAILLSNKVSIYSDADLYAFVHNEVYNEKPQEFKGGYPLIRSGFYGYEKEMSFEYAHSYVEYSSNIGRIALKVEPIIWGNGKYPIILSDNVPPFPMLSWDKNLGKSKFSFFHGSIMPFFSDTLANGLIISDDKYLVGHRWEINFSKRFRAAFTEMLVYGGRDPELVYFLPTIFLWPIQHNMTSQSGDNILWFFETEYLLKDGYNIYSTIMIDELNTKQIFNNYYGNRWVIQMGFQFATLLSSLPTDFRLEFTAARPWAYTHRVPAYGTYTHNQRSLGFKYGPNSQLFLLESIFWLNSRNTFNISYKKLKKGQEPLLDQHPSYDFGDDVNQDYSKINLNKYGNDTKWLIGDINTLNTLDIFWLYQFSNSVFINLGLSNTNNVNTVSIQFDINY